MGVEVRNMMPSELVSRSGRIFVRSRLQIAGLSLALVAGGCSADVSRFDFPAFNLNGNTDATAAIPRPSEPARSGGFEAAPPPPAGQGQWRGGAYHPPGSGARDDVRMSALPETPQPAAPPPAARSEPMRVPAPPAAAPRSVYEEPIAKGDEIVVGQGDTLYGLSRRHGVGLSELMAVNGLTGPAIKPGQRLHLPSGTRAQGGAAPRTPAPAPAAVAEVRPTADAPSDWNGSHTMAPGESLYKVSRQYNVKTAELQRVNGITDPRRIRPGHVLKVPGAAGASSPAEPSRTVAAAKPEADPPAKIASTTQPTIINGGEKRVAALPAAGVSDAPAVAAAPQPSASAPAAKPVQVVTVNPADGASQRLRWPVKGKVISGFGQRADGTHNDGINLAVPLGTEVHAAEDGVVAYAGSELKGYGNLVLLRHDNGWVTAYAHNDEMMVKRGDKVSRGQIIAKAGKSGQVEQPQVHFELRQGAKPVDPIPFLEKS
jgi:murein DD-endopeptidase MepM/ murein hydrolase activator NlpD